MKKADLEAMSLDDLWVLHETVSKILSSRIISEKRELEKRLAYLNKSDGLISPGGDLSSRKEEGRTRRKYPRVLPKYRNPAVPSETWSGRGKQPRWLVSAIRSGRKIDDFKIGAPATAKNKRQKN
jgi:DNA-binding protein H-NS